MPAIEPRVIEAVLRDHPAIAQAAVQTGAPREDGQPLVVRIVPRDRAPSARALGFSLFYFADAEAGAREDKYRLYLEGARFADAHGFEAIWTPERHFHENGGLYPNPSVLSAALATITRHVRLRSGSVALPLHHPLRVAEEWSVVDNLSNGRVDLSFTSGWIPNDFAIAPTPGVFKRKRETMFEMVEQVQRLWRGGTLATRDGVGNEVELRIFPRPIQERLPVWITCSGDPESFVRAGELGFNVLTALLTQPIEEAAEKAALYRAARARVGLDPEGGSVTLMLHTFVGRDENEVRAQVEGPLTEYLRSHIGLMKTMVKSLNLKLDDMDVNDPKWAARLASFAFERYYRMGSLIGTPDKCLEMVNRIKSMGFDEVACLIDFGVPVDAALGGLPSLYELKKRSDSTVAIERGALMDWLRERLGGELPPMAVMVCPELPRDASRATQPAKVAPISSASPTSPTLRNSALVDRAQKQKAAMERQKQRVGKER
ncbi:MupA/Atu3671 family FMN-dependent luciferase-like monooxygenase [Pendulispora albinea]|uniref:LLM class flavin-dependent oxidoreductase n=1 Tax=Pendulispora albinea TaxID=2741071 RepID=A0ABZ2MA41_9BACT